MAPQRIFHPPQGFDYRTSYNDPSGVQWLSEHDLAILVTIDSKVGEQRQSSPRAAYGIYFGHNSRHNEQGLLPREVIQKSNLNAGAPDLYAALCAVTSVKDYALGTPIKMVVLRTATPGLGEHMDKIVWRLESNGYRDLAGNPYVNTALIQELHKAFLRLESMGTEVKFWAVSSKVTGVVEAGKLCVAALKGTLGKEQMDEQLSRHFPDRISSLALGSSPLMPPSSMEISDDEQIIDLPAHSPLSLETMPDPPYSPESPPPRESPEKKEIERRGADRIFNPSLYFDNTKEELSIIDTNSSGFRALPKHEQSLLIDIYAISNRKHAAYGVYFGEQSHLNCWGILPGVYDNNFDQTIELHAAIDALRAVKKLAWGTKFTVVVLKFASSTAFLVDYMVDVVWKWEENGWRNAKNKAVSHVGLYQNLQRLFLDFEAKGTAIKIWRVPKNSNKEAEVLAKSALTT